MYMSAFAGLYNVIWDSSICVLHANFEFTCWGVKTAYVQIKKEQEIFESW